MYFGILISLLSFNLVSPIFAEDCGSSGIGDLRLSEFQQITEKLSEQENFIGCYKNITSLLKFGNVYIWKNDDHFILQTEKYTYKTCYSGSKPVQVEVGGGLTYYVFSPTKVQKIDFIRYKGLTNTRYDLVEEDRKTPCKTMEPPIIPQDEKGNDNYFELKLVDSTDRYFLGLNMDVSSGFKIKQGQPLPSPKYLNGLKYMKKFMGSQTKFTAVEVDFNSDSRSVLEKSLSDRTSTLFYKIRDGTIDRDSVIDAIDSDACKNSTSEFLQNLIQEIKSKI